MSAYTICGCGEPIASEAAAQRHAKGCGLMGYPRTWNGAEPPASSMTDARPVLTLRGWVAVLAAQAEPYDWTRKAGDA